MDEQEAILIKNINEFYRNGLDIEKRGEYNSSTTLFFKALAVLGDLLILRKQGRVPSNHSERFRILETNHPEVYNMMDRDFSFYQNSYKIQLNKDASELIKKDVEKLLRLLEI